MKCNVCGKRYRQSNINILGNHDDLWFISVFCPTCQSQGLIAAIVSEMNPVEIITDLSEIEYARFENALSVDADDVLDMHYFLSDFEGDFQKLFQTER